MDTVILAAPAITAIVALIKFCVGEYRLHNNSNINNSNIKRLNDLKAIIDKLEKESPGKGILNSRYNRLLNSISENSARERYYELYELENENKPNFGYFTYFVFGMLAGATFLNLFITILIALIPKDCLKKIINIKITMNENDLNNLRNTLCGVFFVSVILLILMILVVVFVGNAKGTKKFMRENFNEDIHDSYRYRYHNYYKVLTDDSLKKSLALAEEREKQRKCRQYWTGAGGVLYIFLSYITFYLAINGIDERLSLLKIIFVFSTFSIGLIIILDGLFLKFIKKFIRFSTLPKIKTVESENKGWHEDKDKEKYFLKLIEYIAQSRDSVLYIGSEDVDNSIPSHYINLVSTSYEYMNIEKLKWDHESPKMSFYGTIIIDFIVLPDLPDLPEYRVLETMGSLLKLDGELFVRIRKVRRKKAKEKLETDKKTIEEIGNVAYFPTALEHYQMFGFRKNGN